MKILYDGEIYSIFRHGGVIRYFQHLIAGLPASDTPVLLGNQVPEILPEHPRLEVVVKSHPWVASPFKPVRKWLDRGYCQRKWQEIEPDLIHPTYFNEVARGRYRHRRVPLVLTIYDMIHERFPAQVDPRGRHSEKKRLAVQQADHLVCISETTRQDLVERFGVAEEKTSVTLLGVDDVFFAAHDPAAELAAKPNALPCFVFVGRRDRYKNFHLVLSAFQQLKLSSPGCQLPFQLQVLGAPFVEAENLLLDQLALQDDVQWQPVHSDQTLREWYQRSIGLIYPSLWEGFGLPLLEALAAGTCVVASDIPVFRELVGDGFEPFDPHSAESLVAALLRIHRDPLARQARIQAGCRQLPRYRWEHTVAATRDVYRQLGE
jgi:glycosyltransferase involved in cell wall biosynthesis